VQLQRSGRDDRLRRLRQSRATFLKNGAHVAHAFDTFTQNFSGTTNDLVNGFDYNPASFSTSLAQCSLQCFYIEAAL
jgi:hypothetical protein